MAKAMLVMDMPSSCGGCPLCDSDFYCGFHNVSVDLAEEDCPLREVPQKIGINEALQMPRDGCIADVIRSYNACIDEILGGGE